MWQEPLCAKASRHVTLYARGLTSQASEHETAYAKLDGAELAFGWQPVEINDDGPVFKKFCLTKLEIRPEWIRLRFRYRRTV